MKRGDIELAGKSIELGLQFIEQYTSKELFMTETYLISYSVMHCFLHRGEDLLLSTEINQKKLFGQIKNIVLAILISDEAEDQEIERNLVSSEDFNINCVISIQQNIKITMQQKFQFNVFPTKSNVDSSYLANRVSDLEDNLSVDILETNLKDLFTKGFNHIKDSDKLQLESL